MNIVLMANYRPGLETAAFLREQGETVSRLYVLDTTSEINRRIINASGVETTRLFSATDLDDPAHMRTLVDERNDCIITVYWPYLLSKVLLDSVRFTVNFHPALLPVNAGWYPHVHSLLDGSPCGVTLHAMTEGADVGPIWAQKPVPMTPYDTAGTLYERLQDEIISLFKESWRGIASGEITPREQDLSRRVYHRKSEIEKLDRIDLDKEYKARDLIRLLRARTFGSRGFAYYVEGGEIVHVNLQLGPSDTF